jgi:hypothetical protein
VNFLVWVVLITSIIGGVLMTVALCRYGFVTADVNSGNLNQVITIRALGIITGLITIFFFCILVGMRKAIQHANRVIEEASVAITAMKSIMAFPLVSLLMYILYFTYWIVGTLYIFSKSDIHTRPIPNQFLVPGNWFSDNGIDKYEKIVFDDKTKGLLAGHIFHLIWNIQFILYFSYLVVSGTISQWYFSQRVNVTNKSDKRRLRGYEVGEMPTKPVCASLLRTCRFHLGAVAFGSFVIAVVKVIRFTVRYIETKLKKGDPGTVRLFCLKCFSCCLWCTNCCLDKVSQNAFVWVGMRGDSFISSAASSMSVIMTNIIRAGTVSYVSTVVLFIGKLTVAFATTGTMALIMQVVYQQEMSSLLMPCIIIFILAFIVAEVFVNIYDTAIDTVFLCFLVDEASGWVTKKDKDKSKNININGESFSIVPASDQKPAVRTDAVQLSVTK